MTDIEAIEFFQARAARDVRAMPLAEAKEYLRGLLIVANPEELGDLRKIYCALRDCDAQLELLTGPQVKLPLDSNGTQSGN